MGGGISTVAIMHQSQQEQKRVQQQQNYRVPESNINESPAPSAALFSARVDSRIGERVSHATDVSLQDLGDDDIESQKADSASRCQYSSPASTCGS